jgi:biopolymer transport protein ExbD
MAPTNASSAPALSEDEVRRMQYKKALRRKRRKDRDTEGEIHDLNIYPMLDMMTIILVFLLKSYSASSVTLDGVDNLKPPTSSSTSNPKETVALTISRRHILIDNKPVMSFGEDFKIDAADKPEGATGMLVAPLKAALDDKVKRLKKLEALNPETMAFQGELSVIADQHVPYRLLMEVLYTAGQAELNNYRFIIIQSEGAPTTGPAPAGG